MTVNLDVFMYLARIALVIAGVIAIVYLVLLFKSVIDTLKSLQNTLDTLNRDLAKLESPLDTIGSVSNTVDQVQESAKKAAMGAIKVFSQGTQKVGSMVNRKKEDTTPQSEASGVQPEAVFTEIRQTEIIEPDAQASSTDQTQQAD